MLENYFFIQLLGWVACGSFVGEFKRASIREEKLNTPSMLAGGFLSYIAGYALYLASSQREISLLLAGFIAYQDEEFINNAAKRALKLYLDNGRDQNGKR